ncbi:unnamed protein product [Hymenolepis diminuta]|uniref:DUF5727 domain-containing protein n=1 Tax=Hymenolepis diminuta TaxID=6216 RepID=A0A3P6ZKG7_HYMDI|nr:unnamed protein product [Hymenolepis diminuta]
MTVDKENDQIIYNATFSKTANKKYETYMLKTLFTFVSVTLDWDNVGEAPEVKACGGFDDYI